RGCFRDALVPRPRGGGARPPPPPEPPEDVAPPARHFLQKSARELGVEPKVMSDDALKMLTVFGFPGNVRQLENVCHWVTVMAPGHRVDVGDLPAEVREPPGRASQAATAEADWRNTLDHELAQALVRGERGVGDRL